LIRSLDVLRNKLLDVVKATIVVFDKPGSMALGKPVVEGIIPVRDSGDGPICLYVVLGEEVNTSMRKLS